MNDIKSVGLETVHTLSLYNKIKSKYKKIAMKAYFV